MRTDSPLLRFYNQRLPEFLDGGDPNQPYHPITNPDGYKSKISNIKDLSTKEYPDTDGNVVTNFLSKIASNLSNRPVKNPVTGKVHSRESDYGGVNDLYNKYFGQPLKTNTVQISKYRPTNESDKSSIYYSVDDPLFKKQIVDEALSMGLKLGENKQARGYQEPSEEYKNLLKKRTFLDRLKNPFYQLGVSPSQNEIALNEAREKDRAKVSKSAAIGGHRVSRGKDEKGEYISYYDSFDYTTGTGSSTAYGTGHPFELYDRIYLDSKGNPIYKTGGLYRFDDGGGPCYDAKGNIIPCDQQRLQELGSDAYTAMQPFYNTVFEAANKYANPKTGMVSPFNNFRAGMKGLIKHPGVIFMKRHPLPDEAKDPYNTGSYQVDEPGKVKTTYWPSEWAEPRKEHHGLGDWFNRMRIQHEENKAERQGRRDRGRTGCWGANCYENDNLDQSRYGGQYEYGPGGETTDGCPAGYSKHPLTKECIPNGWVAPEQSGPTEKNTSALNRNVNVNKINKIVEQQRKNNPNYIESGNTQQAQLNWDKGYTTEAEKQQQVQRLRDEAMKNSELAQSFAGLTPSGDINAGVIGANTFVNMNPIIGPATSAGRLTQLGLGQNPYGFDVNDGLSWGNTLGALGVLGDVAFAGSGLKPGVSIMKNNFIKPVINKKGFSLNYEKILSLPDEEILNKTGRSKEDWELFIDTKPDKYRSLLEQQFNSAYTPTEQHLQNIEQGKKQLLDFYKSSEYNNRLQRGMGLSYDEALNYQNNLIDAVNKTEPRFIQSGNFGTLESDAMAYTKGADSKGTKLGIDFSKTGLERNDAPYLASHEYGHTSIYDAKNQKLLESLPKLNLDKETLENWTKWGKESGNKVYDDMIRYYGNPDEARQRGLSAILYAKNNGLSIDQLVDMPYSQVISKNRTGEIPSDIMQLRQLYDQKELKDYLKNLFSISGAAVLGGAALKEKKKGGKVDPLEQFYRSRIR